MTQLEAKQADDSAEETDLELDIGYAGLEES
jgi:hypothetical protein